MTNTSSTNIIKDNTTDKPSFRPVKKVTVGVITDALVTAIVLILNTYHSFFKQKDNRISGELSSAATTILTFAVSYFVPPGKDEKIIIEKNLKNKNVIRSGKSS